MQRVKRGMAVALTVVCVVSVASCSDDDPEATARSSTTPADLVKQCASIVPVPLPLGPTDDLTELPDEERMALAASYQGAATTADELADAVAAAGGEVRERAALQLETAASLLQRALDHDPDSLTGVAMAGARLRVVGNAAARELDLDECVDKLGPWTQQSPGDAAPLRTSVLCVDDADLLAALGDGSELPDSPPSLDPVDCRNAHDLEHYVSFAAPTGDVYPGDLALSEVAAGSVRRKLDRGRAAGPGNHYLFGAGADHRRVGAGGTQHHLRPIRSGWRTASGCRTDRRVTEPWWTSPRRAGSTCGKERGDAGDRRFGRDTAMQTKWFGLSSRRRWAWSLALIAVVFASTSCVRETGGDGEGGTPTVPPAADCTVRGPGVDLHGCDLSDENLSDIDLTNANLTSADLSGAQLVGTKLDGARLTGANLYQADLSGASAPSARFDNANLEYANLSSATLTGANLQGATLYRAVALGTQFGGADFSNADLTQAEVDDADFTGATLANTTCPGGTVVSSPAVCPVA